MWTDTTIEQLITQYRQHAALWDPSNKGYRNRFRRDSALKEIAKTMKMDTVDVERKIIVLKTQFRRAHAKALKMRATGLSELDIDNSVWHWYRSLAFLEKRYFSRMPVGSSIMQLIPEQEHKSTIEEFDTSSDDGLGTNGIKIEYSDITPSKRPRTEDEISEKESNTVNANCSNETVSKARDECDAYGELLAIKLKKFDERTQFTIMHEIDNLIFRTRMNYN